MRPCTRRIVPAEGIIKATSLNDAPRRTRSLVQNRPRRTSNAHQASRRIRMTTSLRSRLSEPGAIVALGAHDGLTARIAERAGIEALYHGGYATAAHHFGLPDVGLIGRAEVVESVRRMRGCHRPADRRRRRHRLRLRGGRLAHGPRARGRRRQRGADRGSGLAQALRPHGGQGGDPGRRDGDQGPRRRGRETLGRDADHRAVGCAPGDRARGHARPLQRLQRCRRRSRVRRRPPHRGGVRRHHRELRRRRA